MRQKILVMTWFTKWQEGDFLNLPITKDFRHISPYGEINGKDEYINLIKANQDKFLGHNFEIHDEIYSENKACVRYTAVKPNFKLEVSEWYLFEMDNIKQIIAYYNIDGEISSDKKLNFVKN